MKSTIWVWALSVGVITGGAAWSDEPEVIEAKGVEEVVPGETTSGWSLWEVPGFKQIGTFFDQAMTKSRLKQAFSRMSAQWSDRFVSKEEAKKDPIKVQAIQYLAKLDSHSYPEVVDTLLASLDDASEKVRYEALQALRAKQLGSLCLHQGDLPAGESCTCVGCTFRKKVIDRLNALLLDQDESGSLKEKSERIRDLATEMIEQCLSSTADNAQASLEESLAEPARKSRSRSFFPRWFGGKESADAEPVKNGGIVPHTVGYRGDAKDFSQKDGTAPAVAGERVIIAPPQSTWETPTTRPWRLSSIFGY
jgi:hypothetical protein